MSELVNEKVRKGNRYGVAFPTLPSLTLVPRRVELVQKPYHHDVLIMEFSQFSPVWFRLLKTGVPLSFEWTQGAQKNAWCGYVSFVTKQVSPQQENYMEVHCVGSSFLLKERATRVFERISIPNAVKQIVTEFGFNFIGDDNGVLFDQLTMAGHSYWEWIHEQAKRIGYAVSVDKTDFYFKPLDQIIDLHISNVAVLSMTDKGVAFNARLVDRTLDWFKVLNGEHIEGEGSLRTVKTVAGVDPTLGTLVTSTSSPKSVGENLRATTSDVLFSELVSSQVVNTSETANVLSRGAAQLGRFNMPAKIKCQGDPRIKPFAPIYISGTGEMTDGFWISNEVKHMWDRQGNYLIEMKAAVDGTGVEVKTALKSGTTSIVGMVNLNQTDRALKPAKDLRRVTLSSKTHVSKENVQGLNRAPATWKHYPSTGGN